MDRISRIIVFTGICLLVAFIPLPYGGIEEGAIFIFEAGVFVIAGIHALGRMAAARGSEQRNSQDAERLPWPLKALLAIFFGLALWQIVPLPRGIVGFLSPRIFEIKSHGAWISLSLAPALSLYELLKYTAYAIFGYLVFVQAGSKRKVHILVFVMLASGLFQSLYGLAEYFGGSHAIFGWKNIYNQDAAFGTFVNRNHYSAFLEMVLALSIGYLLSRADFFAMKPGLSLREKIVWFGQERLQKTIIAAIVPVFLGVGIIFSWSRTGVFVFLAELLTMIVLVMWAGKRRLGDNGNRGAGLTGGDGRERRLIRTVFAGVAGIALLLGIAPLLARFSAARVLGEHRPLFYTFTVDMIRAFPLTGIGPGCFLYGYNMFVAENTPRLMTHAHNDYLELLAESGLPGGIALLAAALAALAVMAARWLRRRDNFVRGVVLGSIAGITGMLLHSFTDFSLRMPANVIYLVAIYALGLRTVGLREGAYSAEVNVEVGPGKTNRRIGILQAAAAVAGLIVLLLFTVRENMGFVRLANYDLARARLAAEGRSLMSGFSELDRLLEQAAWWSGNPRFSEEQGRLYIEMAVAENESDAPVQRDAYLVRAEAAMRRRIRQNPADAMAYYDMSRIYLLYNFPLITYQDAARHYLRQALAFKPHDLFLNIETIYIFAVLWDGLNGEEKAWLFKQLRSVWPVNEELFYPQLFARWQREVRNMEQLKEILGLDPEVWRRAMRFFK